MALTPEQQEVLLAFRAARAEARARKIPVAELTLQEEEDAAIFRAARDAALRARNAVSGPADRAYFAAKAPLIAERDAFDRSWSGRLKALADARDAATRPATVAYNEAYQQAEAILKAAKVVLNDALPPEEKGN